MGVDGIDNLTKACQELSKVTFVVTNADEESATATLTISKFDNSGSSHSIAFTASTIDSENSGTYKFKQNIFTFAQSENSSISATVDLSNIEADTSKTLTLTFSEENSKIKTTITQA